MKGQTADKRNTDAKTLLNYGFSTYALADIAPQEPLAPVPVRLGAEDAVQPVLPSGSTLLVEKTKAGQLTQSVELPAEVEAPSPPGRRSARSPSARGTRCCLSCRCRRSRPWKSSAGAGCSRGCCGARFWPGEELGLFFPARGGKMIP